VSRSIRFAEPIVLEDGSKLATLRDAIRYLAQIIPKPEGDMLEVLTASDLLTQAAERDGPGRVRTHRHAAGDQSPRRAGFRFITQRHALGKAEIKKGYVTKPGARREPAPSPLIVRMMPRRRAGNGRQGGQGMKEVAN
jgi:hypothetical protein